MALDTQSSASLDWRMGYPSVVAEPLGRIRVAGTLPPWWYVIEERLRELLELPQNWDRRGASRIAEEDMVDALRFLQRVMRDGTQAPWVGPLVSGGIELAWRQGEVEVEAVFDHARDERELLVSVGESEWDSPIDQAESLFATVVDRLCVEDVVAA